MIFAEDLGCLGDGGAGYLLRGDEVCLLGWSVVFDADFGLLEGDGENVVFAEVLGFERGDGAGEVFLCLF